MNTLAARSNDIFIADDNFGEYKMKRENRDRDKTLTNSIRVLSLYIRKSFVLFKCARIISKKIHLSSDYF